MCCMMTITHMMLQARPRYSSGAKNCLFRTGSCARDMPCDCEAVGNNFALYPIVSGVLQAVCSQSLIPEDPCVLPPCEVCHRNRDTFRQ